MNAILIIASNFPPFDDGVVGSSIRVSSLVEYFNSKGITSHVLISKHIHTVPKTELRVDCCYLNFQPDYPKNIDKFNLLKFCVSYIKKHDISIAFSSSPLFNSHKLAYSLKQTLKDTLYWICDTRDMLSKHPSIKGQTKEELMQQKRMELEVWDKADLNTFVSKGMLNSALDAFIRMKYPVYPAKMTVVENGYRNVEVLDPQPEFEKFVKNVKNNGKIVLLHAGSGSFTRCADFNNYKSISRLTDFLVKYNENSKAFALVIQGTVRNIDYEYLDCIRQKLDILILAPVSNEQMRANMKTADIGVSLNVNREVAPQIMGGKLYDYMAAGIPLLCIFPDNAYSLFELSRKHDNKLFIADVEDDKSIENILQEIILNKNNLKKRAFNSQEIITYSREYQYEKIFAHLCKNHILRNKQTYPMPSLPEHKVTGDQREKPGEIRYCSNREYNLHKLSFSTSQGTDSSEQLSHDCSSEKDWKALRTLEIKRLYAGDIPDRIQYNGMTGLSIHRRDYRHIQHDITKPFPIPDNYIDSFQSEDFFEHIPCSNLVPVINEIYRILKPGSLFRLSLPDYGCDILRERSIKNDQGEIMFDPGGGGTPQNPGHLWFPRFDQVQALLDQTLFARHGNIEFLHYYRMDGSFVTKYIDYTKGLIQRTPDFDPRVQHPYRPLSIVVDLTKKGGAESGLSATETSDPFENLKSQPKIHVEHRNTPTSLQSTTLRFLQVHTFYAQYLQQFYNKIPVLANKPYDFQNKALIHDFFSGIHIVAPYMRKIGYNSGVIIANCAPAQRQWAREMGLPTDGRLSSSELLLQQIQAYNPDVLYLTDPITFDSKFVRLLPKRPKIVMGWRAAVIPAGVDWSEFDVILSNMAPIREVARLLGARASEEFYPGVPGWVINTVLNTSLERDIGFSCQYTHALHEERNRYLDAVARTAGQYGFSCALHLSGETQRLTPAIQKVQAPPLYGLAMHKMLAGCRIAFDGRAQHWAWHPQTGEKIDLSRNTTGNMRIFEATGSGAFLLTPEFDNLKACFIPGQEIETYASEKELVDKLRYYLSHEEARQAIAQRGSARCRSDHSMEKRVLWLDQIIKKYLNA